MPDTSAILRYRAFWRFYVRASDEPLDDEALRHWDTITINGREYPEGLISLPCGAEFSLEVKMNPHPQLRSINLGLRNATTGHIAEMGWWDDARWHPHALRWSELAKLHQYWLGASLVGIHPSAAFLLLALFIGHGANERDHFSERQNRIAIHFDQLRLFAESEIRDMVDRTFILPTEADYNWSHDNELGWVFGGDYPCYSIRNREHSGGAEGRFPFSMWSRLMAGLPKAHDEE